MGRRLPAAVIASVLTSLAILLPSTAGAGSICAGLQSRIAGQATFTGSSQQSRDFARAIVRQKLAIRQGQAERRRLGCGAGSIELIGDQPPDPCKRIDKALARMSANLDSLVAARDNLLVSQPDAAEMAALKARFDAMGCSETPALVTSVSVDANLPVSETIRVPDDGSTHRFVDLGGADVRGALKTVCVRTCDGGFFPISSHASPTAFNRDAQVCSMMCPGVETELYYQPLTSDDTAAMISAVTGRRYEDMPKAFAFRTARRQGAERSCGCDIALYTREMMRREAAIVGRMSLPDNPPRRETAMTWIKPALRTTLGADKAAPLKAAAFAERAWDPSRKIRKVGPDFIPAEKIDFSKPLRVEALSGIEQRR